jgi:hypothetical protein
LNGRCSTMPSIKMPTPIKRPTSNFYWIRKKVPERLRDLVGKTEIWASLGTKDQRKAAKDRNSKCVSPGREIRQ